MRELNLLNYKSLILILILSLSSFVEMNAQEEKRKYESFDTKREEIQRYFGYEILLYRYLSVPYDVSVQANQTGNFVEIGFLLIIFMPLVLLILFMRKPVYYWLFLLYLIFLWIISTSNSWMFSHQKSKIDTTPENLTQYIQEVSFQREPLDMVAGRIHLVSQTLYKPFKSIGEIISGNEDYITYPILFLFFVLMSIGIIRMTGMLTHKLKLFIALTWLYYFYWTTFGGGIIWYGYILILLLYISLIKLFELVKQQNAFLYKLLYPTFVGVAIFWIVMASVDRISNIQPNVTADNLGKGIFNAVFFDYACGKIDKNEAIAKMYPNSGDAIARMNSDKDNYIWRVGTSMTYFIENNNERIVMDNQLGLFHPLNYTYPDKEELVEVMKASNFKYLIVDLQTATIDITPNKTLTKKYNNLIEFVTNNPKAKLIGTDRILARINNGKQENYYGFSGDQVYYNGRYAIFEFI